MNIYKTISVETEHALFRIELEKDGQYLATLRGHHFDESVKIDSEETQEFNDYGEIHFEGDSELMVRCLALDEIEKMNERIIYEKTLQ